MPNPDDTHTDELFQVGAERHDFAYDPAAWESMEVLLDTDARARKVRFIAIATATLLLLALLAYLLFSLKEQTDFVSHQEGATVDEARALTKVAVGENTVDAAKATVLSLSVPPTNKAVAGDEATSPGRASVQSQTTAIDGAPMVASTGRYDRQAPVAVSTSTPSADGSFVVGEPAGRRLGIATARLPTQPLDQLIVTDNDRILRELPKVTPPAAFEKSKSSQRLVGTLSAGTIFGRSGSDAFDEPRVRLGAELEYRVGRKFAFSGGAYYNAVCYRTDQENYNPKNDFWHQDVLPDEVVGECTVLEIPISLKYYLNGSANNSFYVGGGASSYLLIKEDYKYLYDEAPAADAKMEWTERMNNQHPLGMGHFSLGYQKRLRGRSSLRVESFVQLPITGIGHGHVRLRTAGVSVNYQFGLRK